MAELAQKLSINAPGRFYVDDSCTDCDLCRQIAPDSFDRSDEIYMSFVTRQPATPEELALAVEAVDSCPTCSIGDDGEDT